MHSGIQRLKCNPNFWHRRCLLRASALSIFIDVRRASWVPHNIAQLHQHGKAPAPETIDASTEEEKFLSRLLAAVAAVPLFEMSLFLGIYAARGSRGSTYFFCRFRFGYILFTAAPLFWLDLCSDSAVWLGSWVIFSWPTSSISEMNASRFCYGSRFLDSRRWVVGSQDEKIFEWKIQDVGRPPWTMLDGQ